MPAVSGIDGPVPAMEPWAGIDDLLCVDLVTDHTPTLQRAITSASWILWALTGRQYGIMEFTVRPCLYRESVTPREYVTGFDLPSTATGRVPITGWLRNGQYGVGFDCCTSRRRCSCTSLSLVRLPRPVQSVEEVTIDGDVLAAENYTLLKRRWLARTDGETWPLCQDVTADLDEEDTFGVTIRKGRAVPQAGVDACARLACEIAKDQIPNQKCSLPERVTSISRDGVTMALLDDMAWLKEGRTGIASVDLFISTANPGSRRRRARLHSVDDLP